MRSCCSTPRRRCLPEGAPPATMSLPVGPGRRVAARRNHRGGPPWSERGQLPGRRRPGEGVARREPTCPGRTRPWRPTWTRWSSASRRRGSGPGGPALLRGRLGVRVALVNHTLEPQSLAAELAWAPPECPGLGAGGRGDRGVRDPGSGRHRSAARRRAGAGHLRSESPSGASVLVGSSWVRWNGGWCSGVGAVCQPPDVQPEPVRDRAPGPGPAGHGVGPHPGRRRRGGGGSGRGHGAASAHLELSSPGAQRVSCRGPVAPRGDGVRPGVGRLARRRAGRASLTVCWRAAVAGRRARARRCRRRPGSPAPARRGRLSTPDQADDALGLFAARAAESDPVDGRGVGLLCGEFERTGDPDLLDYATRHLLKLDRPVPGLGLAAAQVRVPG